MLKLTTPLTKSNYVKFLQKLLCIKEDGSFGNDTDKAVRNYQKLKGLTVDGSVGTGTWTKLLEDNKIPTDYKKAYEQELAKK